MNTLAVFAVSATGGIGVILGSLVAMCWIEQRVVGGRPRRRPRSRSVPSGQQPTPARTHRMGKASAAVAARESSTTGTPVSRNRPVGHREDHSRQVVRRRGTPGPGRTGQATFASLPGRRSQGRVAVASGVLAVAALACVASQRHGNPPANTPR
ncbi:hypothetical protein [Halopolyspora algeriensis]|uniref:hypothetical protein n=1 Tax=Halopolyspora algeriensis TaxID=1500506 RepID=UPI0011513238|nr:hypothetical protein [Halopolyspora algeriensis]